ncbi:MAG: YggS family pyridoxal phosphate-dependent enzyme [Burkholderiales bacterium]|nr:YggS family pyridoxal phosphate-dependent enzyme [Burkholderiales bacterium]
MPDAAAQRLASIRQRIAAVAQGRTATLVAVSKTQPAARVRAMHAAGQTVFGENYVQEALAKMTELADCAIEWHLIGPLQSNKCREVAEHFDWMQTLDRAKLIPLLARHRPDGRAPLNVLVQVNLDDEDSKSGAHPADIDALADAVARQPRLRLRGLMSIPKPWPNPDQRRAGFRALHAMFQALKQRHPGIDTLSMGMSDDFELALAEGATMVRVGSALFGPRG